MSMDERKRSFEMAVKATQGRAQTIMSVSDQNMDNVIELARHAGIAAPIMSSSTPRC